MAKKDIEKKSTSQPSGAEIDEAVLVGPEMMVGDYASRLEAIEKARELLRREAQAGLNRRLGINPKEIVGITFVRSWKNYFADGREYGKSKAMAKKLVESGVARYVGDPGPKPKYDAQVEVDKARARREEKAAKAKEEAEFEAELKAEADKDKKADKKK